jgi:RND family efflux transporter MFP subunit
VAPVALVELQAASPRTLAQTLSAYGTTEFDAASAQTLAVQAEMQVTNLLVTAGSEVKRGQALLQLAPSRTTGLELGRARRDADQAMAERERIQRLRAEGLATESELVAAANAANTAVALRDSLSARIGPEGLLTLRAPRDGVVESLAVQPGDVLPPGSVAVRIAAPDALQVRLGVEPADARRVAIGQSVRLVPLKPGASEVQAVVSGVDRRVDAQTRLIAALVRLPVHSGLLPGEVLRADIVVAARRNVVTVPRAALLYAGEQPYVFVAAGGKAQRHDVAIGVQDGGVVEITAGIRPGDQVVVAGNAVLEDGMGIRTQATTGAPR